MVIRFWMELSGDGPLPVMHFGMNGMLMVGHLHCMLRLLEPSDDLSISSKAENRIGICASPRGDKRARMSGLLRKYVLLSSTVPGNSICCI
jgi:hypothetical protein